MIARGRDSSAARAAGNKSKSPRGRDSSAARAAGNKGKLARGIVLLSAALFAAPVLAQDIPKHPTELTFPDLSYEPPAAAEYQHVLENGTCVFLAPSKELPLIDITFTFKGGRYLEEPGSEGLAAATISMLRRGGTLTVKPADFDERLDFLAAKVSVGQTDYQVTANLNTLKENLHQSFMLFMEMLRIPRYDATRFGIYRAEVLESLKQRNDSADAILQREWTALMYGREHFKARITTKASLDRLTVRAMRGFRRKLLHPGNLVVSVSGDFEKDAMLARLNKVMAGWDKGEISPPAPGPSSKIVPGLYRVEKDIPQGKVNIGIKGIQRDDDDAIALTIMSRILGSSGFTSRITQRVRSDEGLAYSAGAFAVPGLYFRGEIRGFFESKNVTVALATKLIMEEFKRIANEAVTEAELETAKAALIESFPSNFGSKSQILKVFVDDHLSKRDSSYWADYREKVEQIHQKDVQRVAQKYLLTDKMMILVVGKWSEIEPGNDRATMAEFFGGKVTVLPLRDPLTLEPIGK
jgi:zinc protease